MNILFYLCGDRNKASSRVRGYWIAEALEELGVRGSLEHRHSKAALLLFALKIPFYRIIVFQKSYSRWHCLLMRWANVLGKKTLLDLDDAPSRINHPVTLRNVEFMMRNVSAVTVGSRVLYDYASNFSQNVQLIPSSIRLKYYQPVDKHDKSAQEPVCLGWIGNGKHYKQDLIEILREPLTVIAERYPIKFKLIGACGERELYQAFENIPGLELEFIDQIEWSDSCAVARELQDIDIGLYPLLPGGSNEYKCGFKALEYMAMKIPVVSSDVAENREIIKDGENGFFATDSNSWESSIARFIDDSRLRAQMGLAGRKLVETKYSVDSIMAGGFYTESM